MNHYLKLAATGFAIFSAVGILFVITLSLVQCSGFAGRIWPNWSVPAYFCASGAYLTLLPVIVFDILTLKNMWADPRTRTLGVPLVGASLGLYLLGWVAVFNPFGSFACNTLRFDGLFYPHKFSTMRSFDLIGQAEMIGMCKMFMDYSMQVSVIFAFLAAVGVKLYDKLKLHWMTVTFAFAYLFVLPLIFTWAQDVREVFTRDCFPGFFIFWLTLGGFAGVGLSSVVWSVRAGYWDF